MSQDFNTHLTHSLDEKQMATPSTENPRKRLATELSELREWIAELAIPETERQRVGRILHDATVQFERDNTRWEEIEAAGLTQGQLLSSIDEQRRIAIRQTMLYSVLRAVAGQTDPDYVARSAVEVITKVAGWPNAAVILPDEDGTHWVIRAAGGRLATMVGHRFPAVKGIVGRAFRTTRTQLVPDVRVDPDYIAGNPAVRSELAVPLRRGGRTLGVLNIESDQLAAFDKEDVLLVESLADAVALALDNAHLYSQIHRNAANLSALYTVTRLASESLILEDVLSQALSSALTLLGFSAGFIALAGSTDGPLQIVSEKGLPPALAERLCQGRLEDILRIDDEFSPDESMIGELGPDAPVRAENAVPQPSDRNDSRRENWQVDPTLDKSLSGLGFRSYASIPLLHRGQALGSMFLFSRRSAASLVDGLALLTSIGHQIATAVANARLFQNIVRERSRLQALIESSRDGIILVGMKRRFLLINVPALKLLGLSGRAEDWTNRPVNAALKQLRQRAPAVVKAALAEMRRIVHGDEPPGEGELELPPNTLHWLNLPVIAEGAPEGRLLVLRDVTEERLLAKLRDDLTHTMVHDLRNPLSNIYSSIVILDQYKSDSLPSHHQTMLQIALENTQRMLKMVTDILDLSRLESGRMKLDHAAVSLTQLIIELMHVQSPMANDKGVHLESEVPSTLPSVWCDAGLIERVLQNLVDNAIKFTPGGGFVKVIARMCDEAMARDRNLDIIAEPPQLCISVVDSGPGIPVDLQSRLFQKFVSGNHEGRGSGLGLAFCKLVVEAHGGQIWVESELGNGAVFTFSLPVVS